MTSCLHAAVMDRDKFRVHRGFMQRFADRDKTCVQERFAHTGHQPRLCRIHVHGQVQVLIDVARKRHDVTPSPEIDRPQLCRRRLPCYFRVLFEGSWV